MRKLLVFLIVLLLIVIGADFAGRAIAESKTGEAIARQADITPAPDVDVGGLSFLWQAIGGDYQHITMTSTDLQVGELTGITGTADLYGVELALSDAISGKIDNLTARRVELTAGIPLDALSEALTASLGGAGGTEVVVSAGDDGAVLLSTSVSAAGQSHQVSIAVTPSVEGGALHLANGTVTDAPPGVPAAITNGLIQNLTFDLPLDGLPFALNDASARAEGDTLTVRASAQDVPIGDIING